MATSIIRASDGITETFESFSGSSRNEVFITEPKLIEDLATHSYIFNIKNLDSNPVKVYVEVSNSDDNNHWTVIFEASVSGTSTENFNYKDVFNFKFSRVRIEGHSGTFTVFEAHTPWYRPKFSYDSIPPETLTF